MKIKKIVSLIFICLSIATYANSLKAIGYGKTEKIAKKDALTELSNSIEVAVKSEVKINESLVNEEYNLISVSNVTTKSNQKIIGVKYSIKKEGKNYKATATLDSLEEYYKTIKRLNTQIEDNYNLSFDTSKTSEAISFLENSLKAMSKRNSYLPVIIALKGRDIPSKVSFYEITKELLKQNLKKENKVSMGLSVVGDINSSEKRSIERNFKNVIKDRRIVVSPNLVSEDFSVEIRISDYEVEVVPETMVMPKSYSIRISGVMDIVQNDSGIVVFSQNVFGESVEEIEKRVANKKALNMLGEDFYQNILEIMED